MKISRSQTKSQDWDKVKTWNYKLPDLPTKRSVVYAELGSEHGKVSTGDIERIYYILEGEGELYMNDETIKLEKDDLIVVPANTEYNYKPLNGTTLKVLLFMELWDN